MLDEFTGKGEALRSVAHGDGAAAGVEVHARCSGDVAEDAQDFGYILRADSCGEGEGLLCHHGVQPPLLRRVWDDRHHSGIQWAPKGSRLRTEENHAGVEIHVIDVQAHAPNIDVRIKGHFDAKEVRELFVDRLRIATQVQVVFSGLRL